MEEKNTTPTNIPVNEDKTNSYNNQGGYGKGGGWKKWLLIYVIIAVVVYGLIYLYLKNRSDDSTGGTNNGSIY